MLVNDSLEQPDGIGHSIAGLESLVACSRGGLAHLLGRIRWKHLMTMSDIVMGRCLAGSLVPASLAINTRLATAEGCRRVACQQPQIEVGCKLLTPNLLEVIKGLHQSYPL